MKLRPLPTPKAALAIVLPVVAIAGVTSDALHRYLISSYSPGVQTFISNTRNVNCPHRHLIVVFSRRNKSWAVSRTAGFDRMEEYEPAVDEEAHAHLYQSPNSKTANQAYFLCSLNYQLN
jgi:hypothetical protein